MRVLPFLVLTFLSGLTEASRIKDIAMIRGARNNQLLGYGVVVGLAGTGDKASELTQASLGLALKGLGVDLKSPKMDTKNAAAVICSATLPPFSRAGAQLDVTVSSVGSATSLDGGSLMVTALRGPDGQVYAMAQGKIVTTKRSDGGSKATGQTLVTALVPAGAILEKELSADIVNQKELKYQLLTPDFTTAARMAAKINEELAGRYATASDAGSVDVILPYTFEGTPVDVIARIEALEIDADRRAKVIINPRTGTVVLGDQVRVAPVAIAHNNLRIEVRETAKAGAEAEAQASEKTKKVMPLASGASISDIVAGLNDMGASADDLVAMLQSLKASGALMAEVEVQ